MPAEAVKVVEIETPAEASVYFDALMPDPDMASVAAGTVAVLSVRCPGRDGHNEDAAAIIPVGEAAGVLAVADGMGGNAAGEKAARIAIESLQAAVDDSSSTGVSLRTAIINGIEEANESVQRLGVGAGTTLVVVEIENGVLRAYHIGDSMVIVCGGRGKLKFQTVAHSPVGYGIESGLLDAADAMHHEDRHVVSNFVGTPDMRIDIGPPLKLAPRDTVVLASDGLFDNLHVGEIVECIRKGRLVKSIARLTEWSIERMTAPSDGHPSKPDDVTVVAFRLATQRRC